MMPPSLIASVVPPALRSRLRAIAIVCVIGSGSLASPLWGQWSSGSGGAIYYNGGNVGIGTANPAYRLVIVGSGNHYIQISNNITSALFGNEGNNAKIVSAGGAGIALRTDGGGWSDKLFVTNPGNVGIGTTNPQYKLAVNGTIGAKDVIVTNSGWSDYVFRPGYRLRPLSEVNAYIRAHRHLPDIPTEAEVNKNGVSVGEMQAKLLAKIEELTLHLIQQDKENRELRQRIARLESHAAGR